MAGTGSRAPGTPVRGVLERDVRQRLFSPLHEMDDAAPGAEVHDIATPDTPVGAQQQAPTLQEIATMFRQEVTTLQRAISGLEHKVTGMGDMMDYRMSSAEGI